MMDETRIQDRGEAGTVRPEALHEKLPCLLYTSPSPRD